MTPLALLLGLTLGTGLTLAFTAVLPAAPLDLAAALGEQHEQDSQAGIINVLGARRPKSAAALDCSRNLLPTGPSLDAANAGMELPTDDAAKETECFPSRWCTSSKAG